MTDAAARADIDVPYRLTFNEVVSHLGSNIQTGLSSAEAKARVERVGHNELTAARKVPGWRKFLAQFKDKLVALLLIATAISAGLWLYEKDSPLPYEAIAIFGVVLLNAVLGYVQNARAEAAVAALGKMAADKAIVVRGGEQVEVSAADLVPGDLILVQEGDTIPADARLVKVTALQVAEAALTGESLPVPKGTLPVAEGAPLGDRHNMLFSGTAAIYGHGKAVVTATGMRTEMGRIAGLLDATPDETTPLQKQLDYLGKVLGIIVVVIAVIMVVTIFLMEDVRSVSMIVDTLILAVALAVAAVPEGLPAVVTAVLSIGVQRMAKRKAIVRHLAAVETLGSANVIASDKTGTLTKNEMTVRTVVTASGRVTLTGTGYSPEGEIQAANGDEPSDALWTEVERALTVAERANNAAVHKREGKWIVLGDPTEGALLVAARKAGLKKEVLEAKLKRVAEVPFSSERKLMSTVHVDQSRDGELVVMSKGAPDVLLSRCTREFVGGQPLPLTAERRAEILKTNDQLASQALRTLGIAGNRIHPDSLETEAGEHLEQELVFLGIVGMIDPPRPEAKDAVARARAAGIRPIMITGDHPKTAGVIAAELGIAVNKRVVTGTELEKMSDEDLANAARDVSVYARVNPEHKLRIVKALQSRGDCVAMTGDGVNDAPALKTADIGVAMGITGTDVSKEAADVILTDDNFATIVAAVEDGRVIFANTRKILRFLLSSNIGEVLTMFLGVLLAGVIGLQMEEGTLVLPLLATHILWINLVTDVTPALALGVDPAIVDVMRQRPRPRGEGIVTREMWTGIFVVGLIMAATTLAALDFSLPGGLIEGTADIRYAQTMALTTMMIGQLYNVLNARSDVQSAFRGLFQVKWVWCAIGLSLALQLVLLYVPFMQQAFSTAPLRPVDWLRCGAFASPVLLLRELSKVVKRLTAGDVVGRRPISTSQVARPSGA